MMRAKIATCTLLLACSFHLNAASLPEQGMTMSKVEQDFGSPVSKSGPVGHPPITRWVYDGFVVVFERSKVVHSLSVTGKEPVARPVVPANTAPAPAKPAAPVKAKAPAPSAAPAAAPAAAPVVQKPAEPVATPQNDSDQADAAEQARRQAEREAMRKARAEAAAKAAAQNQSSGEGDTPAAPAAPTPAEAAPTPKRTAEDAVKAAPGFSFDPATGRVILK